MAQVWMTKRLAVCFVLRLNKLKNYILIRFGGYFQIGSIVAKLLLVALIFEMSGKPHHHLKKHGRGYRKSFRVGTKILFF
jgi:hypothetical protein